MVRRSILLVGVGVIAACALVMLAQSQEGKPLPERDAKRHFADAAEKASAPTAEHKRLAVLVGEFDQAVEVRMGSAEPLRSHVLATGAWIMGGRFVQITARSAPDEELKGERLIIYGYDTRADKYTLWTVETGATFAVSATGDYDAATKTFTFDGERYAQGTSKVPFRWVLRLKDGGAYMQEILMKSPQADGFVPVIVVENSPRGR